MIIITSRCAIAVHILTLVGSSQNPRVLTSEYMAGSIGVNPVIVRNVTGQLRKAGLLQTHQGAPGVHPSKALGEVTLLDVYRAVDPDVKLFSIHERPNPQCPVARNIQATLDTFFGQAQRAMEAKLAAICLDQVIALNQRVAD
jgi:DNA-binding IscR family transcriptional regulator